jgi:hypothetical protein
MGKDENEGGWGDGPVIGFLEKVNTQRNVLRIRPAKQASLSEYSKGTELLIRILDVSGDEDVRPSDLIPRTEVATAKVLESDGFKELEVTIPEVIDEEEEREQRQRFITGVKFDILGGF